MTAHPPAGECAVPIAQVLDVLDMVSGLLSWRGPRSQKSGPGVAWIVLDAPLQSLGVMDLHAGHDDAG